MVPRAVNAASPAALQDGALRKAGRWKGSAAPDGLFGVGGGDPSPALRLLPSHSLENPPLPPRLAGRGSQLLSKC